MTIKGYSPRVSRAPDRRAFTLIELLSVVVIIGLLAGVATPKLTELIDKARVARAIGDLRSVAQELAVRDSLPASLTDIGRGTLRDPWGRPYVYVRLPDAVPPAQPAGARLDRFGVAINSRFDLYSSGRDGTSSLSLTAANSQDDVVSGGDGGFMSLASRY